ncbi:ion transporter [Alkalimarinus alittae]|uniref:Ion transporter n=1 Tax=Alkalimarinus alittae TaxID=2961619 RepID=A0ABY6MZN4_9ALTE|nr:ion transporter [Alkalimarinus alittae]UZE95307.1 ion transporter [Alkalimarinus alittae]
MPSARSHKETLFEIIFESDTHSGKWFDIALIICIVISVAAVMLDSIPSIREEYRTVFQWLEWTFTILFTIEYAVRIYCVPNRMRYIFSFYGLVDLVAIIPTYLGLFITDVQYLLVIRILRILRIFRILKLTRYISQAKLLTDALYRSQEKVTVFFFSIFSLAVIFGAAMYIVEGAENGFTSIPKSVYWAIVTITTVGYGDISPQTGLGQVIASVIMVTGYSIIAIPTGIFAAELSQVIRKEKLSRVCPGCKKAGHEAKANYCDDCGAKL